MTKPRRLGTFSTTADATEPVAPPKSVSPVVTESRSRPRRRRWDQLERKEARLRPDQVETLARTARSLSRQARRSRPADTESERITDNTLIRVAVDLLLTRRDQIAGTTEAELRRSVGLTD